MSSDLDLVFTPGRLGSVTLRNRLIKAATYEGMTPRGVPHDGLLAHHRALAKGGVGMTTVAYCAVSPEGRTFDDQLVLGPDSVRALSALTSAVHAEGAAVSLQLGHAGYFTKSDSLRALARAGEVRSPKPLGPSALWNPYGIAKGLPRSKEMDARDRADVAAAFARSAKLALEAGFDAVELHYGHGYLLSQFLSPWTNRRTDEYGGPIENRMRFPLEVLRAVRDAVGDKLALVAKLNLRDGFEGGLEVSDSVVVAQALEREGIDLIVPSAGFVSRSAFYLLRGEVPLEQMIAVEKSALQRTVMRLVGPALVPAYPYSPLFLLDDARRVREAVKAPVALLGGARHAGDLVAARHEGFDFVVMGRALLADPELPRRYQAGETSSSRCEPCNRCIAEMDRQGGVRCARSRAQLDERAAWVERHQREATP
jgi:2,4-dienoyl-CoA reductase-like NADH-dependent reductase (Old Yellow Enzyme family)